MVRDHLQGARAYDQADPGDAGSRPIKAGWEQCWRNAVRRALTELWPRYEGQPQKAKLRGESEIERVPLKRPWCL